MRSSAASQTIMLRAWNATFLVVFQLLHLRFLQLSFIQSVLRTNMELVGIPFGGEIYLLCRCGESSSPLGF